MKKIIVLFDGTSNDPGDKNDFFDNTSISNICKMQHLLLDGTLYYKGVGTYGNWLQRTWNKIFPDRDIKRILKQAKKDLINRIGKNPGNPPDIYIFGFSRGAIIAEKFTKELSFPVKFLGLFDAVKGGAKRNDIENLSSNVEKCFHLLSLDETRKAFRPTRFKGSEEVWLSGSHSDIGGGYFHDGLADISLKIMLEKAGLDFMESRTSDDLELHPLITAPVHVTERKKLLVEPRELPLTAVIHYTVQNRFNKVPEYRPYNLRNKTFWLLKENGDKVHIQGLRGLRWI